MKLRTLAFVALASLVSNAGLAQQVDPGMRWTAASGTTAGSLCGGFSCTPPAIPAIVGDTITISLRGTFGTAWAIGLSSVANQCIAIPGIHNFLILDNPTIAMSGVFTQQDGILSCPGGVANITFTFPNLPAWTPLAIQAVGQRPDLSFSLTSAITIWVL